MTASYFVGLIISSFFGIVLWAARLPFPMHIQKEFPTDLHLHLGLKTLIFPEATTNPDPHVIHNHKLSLHSPSTSRTSSLSSSVLMDSSSSWSSSAMDDLIGTESGAPIMSNEEQEKLGLLNNQDKRKTTTKESERIMIKGKFHHRYRYLHRLGICKVACLGF